MGEGYLLLRKLETNIELINSRMRTLAEPLNRREQGDIVERIKRIEAAFRQLMSVKGGSIRVSDALRFVCLLIDLINMFLFMNPKAAALRQLQDLKGSLVSGKELMFQLKLLMDKRGNDLGTDGVKLDADGTDTGQIVCRDLGERLAEFEKLTAKYCANQSLLSLEEIIEQFYKRQLDASTYPTLKLTGPPTSGLIRSASRNKIIVLMLGSMSYDELHRIKLLELALMKSKYQRVAKPTGKSSPIQTDSS